MAIVGESLRRTGLVAVEHDLFRVVVTTILESEFRFARVLSVGSFDEVLDRLASADDGGHLVLIDIGARGLTEPAHLTILRERFPGIRLVACGPMRRADVLLALQAGVHGYISDRMGIQDLTLALSTILADRIFVPAFVADLTPQPLDRAVATRGQRSDDLDADASRRTVPRSNLTPRQRDVLRLIVQGHSNKEIAQALKLHESTVKVHLAAIFRTLGVHSRSGAAGIGTWFMAQTDDRPLGQAGLLGPPERLEPAQTVD